MTMSHVERRFGLHTTRREPPDLFVLTTVGDFEEEHIQGLFSELNELGSNNDTLFVLVNLSRLGHITSAARAAATMRKRTAKIGGAAFVGASFQQRVLVTLVMKANVLLRRESPIPTAFFDSEAEARAWIEERRA
jgi:hypothetical protein